MRFSLIEVGRALRAPGAGDDADLGCSRSTTVVFHVPQDAAIVGRTPLAVPATFTIFPTGTYADMHVVTA